MKLLAMSSPGNGTLPKMMLGFVVRRCAVALGHAPSAEEFAAWANSYRDGDRTVCLFGRAISIEEARIILRHPGRTVTAHGAEPCERLREDDGAPASNVTSFRQAIARLRVRGKTTC